MLSTAECRRLLGNPDWSDERVLAVRDSLQAFASLCIDQYLKLPKEERQEWSRKMKENPTIAERS